jgi:TRAP-type C4-dicarboxylate transport system permease small subunit
MLKILDKNLKKIYILSGFIAAGFLILIALFILVGISSRIFGFYIRGLAEYSGYSMAAASFFALSYTFVEGGHIRMLIISYKFQERSEGADEILIWIPQTSVAIGSFIFFICVFHQLILKIFKK